ncbi:MAG: MOSC domain-containing protein [Firmicutes bacterium HGW-Firmicutes-4]|jgi:MOSC domain-containing protein YiiM|nr:MAG: MOSC domain-containing protein [Firmicutes bacterium HGW-Firmicutes-4]
MAKVIAVNTSEKKGVIKQPVEIGECIVDFGIKGDAHGGNWHRQISLLGQESIDKMIAMGVAGLDPGKFAENITTEGIELFTLPIGTQIAINNVLLEVTQIGKECHSGCAIKKQVGDCIMPREGIFVKVLSNGAVRPGDEIVVKKAKNEN